MLIKIRVMGYDLPGAKSADLNIADGAAVSAALEEYLERFEVPLTLEEFSRSQFLIGGAAANPSTALKEGDQLTVLRLLGGG